MNPEHLEGHEYLQLGVDFLTLERQTQMRDWRDSRGLPVVEWPSAVVPSATVIIVENVEANPWRVLVHQRSDNLHFGFPGGRTEVGESIQETARRECLEETGLHVKIERLTSVDSDPGHGAIVQYPDGHVIQYVNCSFLCTVESGDLRISEESKYLFWVSAESLPSPFMAIHQWRLAQAMEKKYGAAFL